MPDGGTALLAAAVLLTLYEAAVWLPADHCVLGRGIGHWRLWGRNPALLGNLKGALRFPGLPPGLRHDFVLQQNPLALGEQSVSGHVLESLAANSAHARRAGAAGYASAPFSAQGARLHDGKGPVLALAGPALASALAVLLNALAKATPAARRPLIRDFLRSRLDERRIGPQLAQLNRTLLPLQMACAAAFVAIFSLTPWLWQRPGAGPLLALLVPAAFGPLIAGLFVHGWRRIHGRLPVQAVGQAISFLIYPPGAFFAWRALSAPALSLYHPIAAGKVLLPPGAFRAFAGELARDARFPKAALTKSSAAAQAFHQLWGEELGRFLQRAGLSLEQLAAAPACVDGAAAYCPRCHAQWTRTDSRCAACGLDAVPFPARG